MNENLNLVEILKDCPSGTKLYSMIHGEVELVECQNVPDRPIVVKLIDGSYENYATRGLLDEFYDGECVLFPSKDQRDWSKFKNKTGVEINDNPGDEHSKFDPKTLQPFDKVLGFFNGVWNCDLYSHYYNDDRMFPYVCFRSSVSRIIPYNEDTKHLAEIYGKAPEFYRYWED